MTGLLVHEWISTHGGSENVLEALARQYDEADILCLWQDPPTRFPGRTVHESSLARRTFLRDRKALALPFMPHAWRSQDLSSYEWALISSHAFAHQLASNPTAPGRVHVYVHTPARYVWTPELDARTSSTALAPARAALRALDRRRVARTASFAANSAFVAARTAAAWDVEAVVIHPPVAVTELQSRSDWADTLGGADAELIHRLPDTFVLGASRFVTYKRLDRAIAVGESLDLPVVIAGAGDDEPALRAVAAAARVPVTFVVAPGNALLRALMQRAALYVFPPVEDFGIMPVEAAALGTPSLVNVVGGARESVERIASGAAVDFDDDRAVLSAARVLIDRRDTGLAARARYFDLSRFAEEVASWRS